MPTNSKTLKLFSYNSVFLETGSYLGDGIQSALDAGFKRIISIEISEEYYNGCKKKFKGHKNVEIILGDSSEVLASTIDKIEEPITFWLDGHYSGGDMPRGKYLSPLLQELEVIKHHPVKSHTVLVDDLGCWKTMENKYHDGFDVEMIEKYLLEINPDYQIRRIDGVRPGKILKNDIMVAEYKNRD